LQRQPTSSSLHHRRQQASPSLDSHPEPFAEPSGGGRQFVNVKRVWRASRAVPFQRTVGHLQRTNQVDIPGVTNSLDVNCSIIVDVHSHHLFDPGGSTHNKALVRHDTTSELDSKLINGIDPGYKSNPP